MVLPENWDCFMKPDGQGWHIKVPCTEAHRKDNIGKEQGLLTNTKWALDNQFWKIIYSINSWRTSWWNHQPFDSEYMLSLSIPYTLFSVLTGSPSYVTELNATFSFYNHTEIDSKSKSWVNNFLGLEGKYPRFHKIRCHDLYACYQSPNGRHAVYPGQHQPFQWSVHWKWWYQKNSLSQGIQQGCLSGGNAGLSEIARFEGKKTEKPAIPHEATTWQA